MSGVLRNVYVKYYKDLEEGMITTSISQCLCLQIIETDSGRFYKRSCSLQGVQSFEKSRLAKETNSGKDWSRAATEVHEQR